MYDLAHIMFLRTVCSKFIYCISLYCCSEWRCHAPSNLLAVYGVKFEHVTCWSDAVMFHFQHIVINTLMLRKFLYPLLLVVSSVV